MRRSNRFLQALAAAAGIALFTSAAPVMAADASADQAAKAANKDLVLRGDAKCTRCHDEGDDYPVLAIGKTRHGTTADGRTPSCTNCHGPSEAHLAGGGSSGQRPPPDVLFIGKHKSGADAINGQCLNCHNSDAKRTHWAGSMHEARGVACTNCHQIHTAHDAVRDKLTQPEVCFNCHKEQRTMVNKPSRHPIPEGKVSCSDCHNPHDSTGPSLMKKDTINDVCYTCHMEKRGPFVHTHEPVAENCANCHNPHGTTAENMLKSRPPFLCQQCRTPHGAFVAQVIGQGQTGSIAGQPPSITGTSAGKAPINFMMARGCTNCHTEVHGSNNPSTANPTPQFMFR